MISFRARPYQPPKDLRRAPAPHDPAFGAWRDALAADAATHKPDEDLGEYMETDGCFCVTDSQARRTRKMLGETFAERHAEVADTHIREEHIPKLPVPVDIEAAFRETWGDVIKDIGADNIRLALHPLLKRWCIFVKQAEVTDQAFWTRIVLFCDPPKDGKLPTDLEERNGDGTFERYAGAIGDFVRPTKADFEFMRNAADKHRWPKRSRVARAFQMRQEQEKAYLERQRQFAVRARDLIDYYGLKEIRRRTGQTHRFAFSSRLTPEERASIQPKNQSIEHARRRQRDQDRRYEQTLVSPHKATEGIIARLDGDTEKLASKMARADESQVKEVLKAVKV